MCVKTLDAGVLNASEAFKSFDGKPNNSSIAETKGLMRVSFTKSRIYCPSLETFLGFNRQGDVKGQAKIVDLG